MSNRRTHAKLRNLRPNRGKAAQPLTETEWQAFQAQRAAEQAARLAAYAAAKQQESK